MGEGFGLPTQEWTRRAGGVALGISSMIVVVSGCSTDSPQPGYQVPAVTAAPTGSPGVGQGQSASAVQAPTAAPAAAAQNTAAPVQTTTPAQSTTPAQMTTPVQTTAPVQMTTPPAQDPVGGAPGTPASVGAAGGGAPTPVTADPPMNSASNAPANDPPPAPVPGGPTFATPDVACGGPTGGFGLGSPNFEMDGREMIVTYPCNKPVGTPMTFFLNLHGTTPVEQHFYQHGYFKAHKFADSHDLIVVTPSSVVEQWGNGDDGQDEPHLMKIIDWVYSTFNGPEAFNIRGMWVGGHSWGAMYTTTFVCKPELADKAVGAVIMSGIGRNPACASKISVISTAAEDDIGPVVDQGNVPTSHGCGAPEMNMITNNEETHWPNCDPGFVHANYFMLGKTHTSAIDVEVVERIADLIVEARQ